MSTRLDSALSSAIDSVAASDPVYGMPSSSHSAGTAASRFRPVDALGDVEHQIDRRLHQLPRQLGGRLERIDLMAVALERLADRVDGLGRVVLGLGVVAALRVDALHVEGEADAQRLGRPPLARRRA